MITELPRHKEVKVKIFLYIGFYGCFSNDLMKEFNLKKSIHFGTKTDELADY